MATNKTKRKHNGRAVNVRSHKGKRNKVNETRKITRQSVHHRDDSSVSSEDDESTPSVNERSEESDESSNTNDESRAPGEDLLRPLEDKVDCLIKAGIDSLIKAGRQQHDSLIEAFAGLQRHLSQTTVRTMSESRAATTTSYCSPFFISYNKWCNHSSPEYSSIPYQQQYIQRMIAVLQQLLSQVAEWKRRR